MSLFAAAPPDADLGYMNLRAQKHKDEQAINAALEALWAKYEPYADKDFAAKLARKPDEHFWEMYLTVSLLEAGKNVRPRSELTKTERDTGPDICPTGYQARMRCCRVSRSEIHGRHRCPSDNREQRRHERR